MFNWFDELKGEIETNIKSGIEALAELFETGIEELLQVPKLAEPFKLICAFCPSSTETITQDGVTIEQDSWRIESTGEKKVLLFEVAEPSMLECVLLCQAQVKTANLDKPVRLTFGSRNPAGWTINSSASVEGTTTWHLCQVTFHYKKERLIGPIHVSAGFESSGVFWLKDVEILQAAVKPRAK